MAFDVISRVRVASISSGEGSPSCSCWPCAFMSMPLCDPWPLAPGLPVLLVIPAIWFCCWATIAVTLTRIGRSRTITMD